MDMKKTPEQVVEESTRLLEEIERSLEESKRSLREKGIDYDEMIESLSAKASPEEKAQARELFRRDMEEVQLAVDQAKSGASVSAVSSASSPTRVKRSRAMV